MGLQLTSLGKLRENVENTAVNKFCFSDLASFFKPFNYPFNSRGSGATSYIALLPRFQHRRLSVRRRNIYYSPSLPLLYPKYNTTEIFICQEFLFFKSFPNISVYPFRFHKGDFFSAVNCIIYQISLNICM